MARRIGYTERALRQVFVAWCLLLVILAGAVMAVEIGIMLRRALEAL